MKKFFKSLWRFFKYTFYLVVGVVIVVQTYSYFTRHIGYELQDKMETALKQKAKRGLYEFPLSDVTPFEWDEMCFYDHDDSNPQEWPYEWLEAEFKKRNLVYSEPHKQNISSNLSVFFTQSGSVIMYDLSFVKAKIGKDKCQNKDILYIQVVKNKHDTKYWWYTIVRKGN